MPDGPVTTPHGSPMQSRQEWLDALDRAARYYREALRNVIEECANDRPRIGHIREAAERGLAAADHELRPSPRPEHDALRRAEVAEADAEKWKTHAETWEARLEIVQADAEAFAQALRRTADEIGDARRSYLAKRYDEGDELLRVTERRARAALAARNKPKEDT